ncbi:uncharacterized protein KGF55_001941 [Candida pseudojiufengensis]|uniref:uncharacterized protein n=1 Tax=Candida pseudojiufengensis TaxID=497109 RepID=UPI00222501C2|nr:uncharacterized protein KGF55_001941 [Candida pseudojiufengensis]KAI5964870.1 hypothetical protein KGF55_001941 [Candida pseudojiufengensis]
MSRHDTSSSYVHHKKQANYHDKRNVLNKSNLVEPIIRHRIQDSLFYKQYLFLTNESTILPIIIEHVKYVSGVDSIGRPSPFLQVLLRLLEIEPSPEVIKVYLNQLDFNEFKYLTCVTLLYIRLVYESEQIYKIFDQYLKDYRKLKIKSKNPEFNEFKQPIFFKIIYMDEYIDEILNNDRIFDIILPRLIPRIQLVERGLIGPRQYFIDEEEIKNVLQNGKDEEKVIEVQNQDNESESSYQSDSD